MERIALGVAPPTTPYFAWCLRPTWGHPRSSFGGSGIRHRASGRRGPGLLGRIGGALAGSRCAGLAHLVGCVPVVGRWTWVHLPLNWLGISCWLVRRPGCALPWLAQNPCRPWHEGGGGAARHGSEKVARGPCSSTPGTRNAGLAPLLCSAGFSRAPTWFWRGPPPPPAPRGVIVLL